MLRQGGADNRPVSVAGAKAVGGVVAASSRVTSAEARLRVFAELATTPSGDDGDGGANAGAPTPPAAATTFVLDFYRAGEAPGLAAVKKGGKAADTAVLYRVAGNVITHAWLAPDRDGLVAKGKAVGEAECLRSKPATAMREVLTEHFGGVKPALYFSNYADIPTIG